jgi:uncharacterized membrane protein
METFIKIFLIVMGCLGVIFRKYFAKEMAGSWGRKYTDRELKMYEMISVIVGILAMGFGILTLICGFLG